MPGKKRASVIVFFLLVTAAILCVPPHLWAQISVDDVHVTPRVEPPKADSMDALDPSLKTHTKPVKVDVSLVLVPVTITDPMNRLVTGLDKENFEVYENKQEQELRTFSSEDAPVSIGVIFDMSGSMSSKIERAREAVIEFFKTANPQDEFFMITFADKPERSPTSLHQLRTFRASWYTPFPRAGRRCLTPSTWVSEKCIRPSIRRRHC